MSAVATKARSNGAVPRKSGPVARPSPGAPPVVGLARRRRPVRVVVGGAVVVVCAIVGALSVAAVDHRVPVLVVTRTVQPGETITRGDLGFARVAGPGLATTSDAATVIGKVASGRLPAGSPIVPAELNAPSQGDANSVELPLALKAGMFPPDLAVGDQVLLVPTASAGTPVAGPAATVTPVSGQVLALVAEKSFGSTSSTTVTVTINRGDLATLANAAAAGQVLVAKAAP
jgi:SAF domain